MKQLKHTTVLGFFRFRAGLERFSLVPISFVVSSLVPSSILESTLVFDTNMISARVEGRIDTFFVVFFHFKRRIRVLTTIITVSHTVGITATTIHLEVLYRICKRLYCSRAIVFFTGIPHHMKRPRTSFHSGPQCSTEKKVDWYSLFCRSEAFQFTN